MSYYYEPDYYAKEMAKVMEKNMTALGESLKERLKQIEDRLKKLEEKK